MTSLIRLDLCLDLLLRIAIFLHKLKFLPRGIAFLSHAHFGELLNELSLVGNAQAMHSITLRSSVLLIAFTSLRLQMSSIIDTFVYGLGRVIILILRELTI